MINVVSVGTAVAVVAKASEFVLDCNIGSSSSTNRRMFCVINACFVITNGKPSFTLIY
jgi:hypothetical protein